MQKLNKGELKMNSSELKGKKVIIAPFSADAIFVYHKLIKEGIDVIAFMDKDKSLYTKQYKETIIIPYMSFPEDIVVIIANTIYGLKEEIKNNILSEGYLEGNIFFEQDMNFSVPDSEIVNEIDIEQLIKIKNRLWVRYIKRKIFKYDSCDRLCLNLLNVVITTKCTLKCKGCSALMDYYFPEQQKDMNLDTTLKCFDKLMSYIDYILGVALIGGEPFVYKDLDKVLEHIVNQSYIGKIGRLDIVTNGTLIPSDSVLKVLGAHNDIITVTISDYGKLSSKKYELIKKLNEYNCTYYHKNVKTWYSYGQPIIPETNIPESEIRMKCEKCDCAGNIRQINNKLYSCYFVAFADDAQLIPYDKRNYLDLYTDEINKSILREFINEIQPGRKYCNAPFQADLSKNIMIPRAEQTKVVKECIRFKR